ncbi:MAG: FecR domain-containing protein [bacterium]|nr:FecR domain-containing protein [bacterium]
MKKALIILGVLVAVMGVFGFFKKNKDDAGLTVVAENIIAPWLDIESGAVLYFDVDSGEYIREAVSGEDVPLPVMLSASEDASAVIFFGDGSEARLDTATQLILEEGMYNPDTDTLTAHLYVSVGRVWSKIIELSTLESTWEVETATAVATVRGTAFGVKVVNGVSTVVGSEHEVSWVPVDEETRERLVDMGVTIKPEDVVSVTREDIRAIKENRAELIVQKHGVDLVKDAWSTNNETRDVKIEQIRQEVQGQIKEVKDVLRERAQTRRVEIKEKVRENIDTRTIEVKDEMRQKVQENIIERKEQLRKVSSEVKNEVREKIQAKILEKKEELKEGTKMPINETPLNQQKTPLIQNQVQIKNDTAEPIRDGAQLVAPVIKLDQSKTVEVSIDPTIKPKPIALHIERVQEGQNPVEGVLLPMRAVAEFSDGTKRDVTSLSEWRVLGPVGEFVKPGVFMPRVFDSDRELGKVSGSVFVAWKSEAGDVVFANSPQFEVRVILDGTVDERG